jgi:uncharacterized protein (DUF4213/DUF364 family)
LSKPVQSSRIAAQLAAALKTRAVTETVADVRIGLGYTAVMLTGGHVGLAYTFREQAKCGCSVFSALRPLAGRPASELLPLLESTDLIEAGVGLACANALANRHSEELFDGDALDYMGLQTDDHVGMIGSFGPLIKTLKPRVQTLTVFEQVAKAQGEVRPVPEADTILPQCQVALITATAIINHTIDHLLLLSSRCREVAVLGASTPMLPGLFSEVHVTLLAGVIVQEAADVMRVVSEGGGMRQFGSMVRKCSRRIHNVGRSHPLPLQGREL